MPPPNPGKAASSTTIATHRKASPCTKPQHVLGSDDSQSRRSTMTDHLEQCDAALKKGLITQGDYDIVKASFIRMESLAMGLKTGLVASSELESIKASFLKAIESTLGPDNMTIDVPEVPQEEESEDVGELKNLSMKPVVRPNKAVSEPPPPSIVDTKPASPTPGAVKSTSKPNLTSTFSPRDGARSVSGIGVTDEAVDEYNVMKTKRGKHRFLTYNIDEDAGMVVLRETGAAATATYDDFLDTLPDAECRYCVYDYDYTNDDNCKFNKFVFVMWSPDIAPIKQKMIYASTKEYFKNCLDGISLEIQGTDIAEVDADSMYEKVRAVMTRK